VGQDSSCAGLQPGNPLTPFAAPGTQLAIVRATRDHTRVLDHHRKYERRQAAWLLVTYVLITILSAFLVLYAAIGVGWRPRRKR
jgi:hypothetical protein